MKTMIQALTGWKGYALTAVVAGSVAFAGGWKLRDLVADAEALERSQERVRVVERIVWRERAAADITETVETEAAEAQVEIRYVTQTQIREVPVYVTPAADDRCIVPSGFVRLHDAAAAGRALPESAGEPHDAPSGVALSAVGETVVANYGTYKAVSRQLIDLQRWVSEQAALDRADQASE